MYSMYCTYVCVVTTTIVNTREGKSKCCLMVVARGYVQFMYIDAVAMLHGKKSRE